MRALKILIITIGVFIIWCVLVLIVAIQQHIGQTYDPKFGAWFVDPSKRTEEATWIGSCLILGIFLALLAGSWYWLKTKTRINPSEESRA